MDIYFIIYYSEYIFFFVIYIMLNRSLAMVIGYHIMVMHEWIIKDLLGTVFYFIYFILSGNKTYYIVLILHSHKYKWLRSQKLKCFAYLPRSETRAVTKLFSLQFHISIHRFLFSCFWTFNSNRYVCTYISKIKTHRI